MNNADLPAMPNSNPETYPTPCAVGYGKGLTKREMFAMHAPQCPSWFAREFKRNNKELVFQNTGTGYKDKLSDKGCEKLFFAWRSYYAEQMLQELES